MAPPMQPGEPRKSPKPQPVGNIPLVFLITTCTLILLFVLWRRANALRSVVAHRLKTWTQSEGQIRLSEDDGPPAREFLEDDYDEDHEELPAIRANGGRELESTKKSSGEVEATLHADENPEQRTQSTS